MPLDIARPTALMSEPPGLRLTGLPSGARVTLHAEASDRHGEVWRSATDFRVPDSGCLELANDVIWNLRPRDDLSNAFFEPPEAGFEVALRLERAGAAETATIQRLTRLPNLSRTERREEGLLGTFFAPPGEVRAGVLMLGDSEGGLYEARAALLASHGFAVLALAYFGLPGLPAQLINPPLETFARAIRWLRARPGVGGRRVGVTGVSKGGEAALLIAATWPEAVGPAGRPQPEPARTADLDSLRVRQHGRQPRG